MSTKSRARAAGRGLIKGAGGTGMAMAGGAIYYGAHTVTAPSLYGADSANVTKRFWMLPVAGIVAGHVLARMPKISQVAAGLVGGATAIGIEQAQLAMQIRKNASATVSAPANTGSLLSPSDVAPRQLASNVGGYEGEDAGALWGSPDMVVGHEAGGLTI
jgi:hypothetical protein